jgi:hypothetical protein
MHVRGGRDVLCEPGAFATVAHYGYFDVSSRWLQLWCTSQQM